jgi:hypothetical protein
MTVTPTQPSNIYLWSTECACAYMWSTLVRGTPPTPPQPTWERPDIDTYTQSGYMDLSNTFPDYSIHAICCSDDGHYLYAGDNTDLLANDYLSDSTYSSFTWTPSSSMTINNNGTRWLHYRNSTNIYSTTDGGTYFWIYQIGMSTWNDLTTGTETKLTESVSSSLSQWIAWSPDGYNLYMCEWGSNVYQYVLSTPRDPSTVTTTKTLSWFWNPYTIRFSPTWLKLFVWDRWLGLISQYNLSTPYDISTAAYANKTLTWYDIFDITDDGRMFCGQAYYISTIYQYDSN